MPKPSFHHARWDIDAILAVYESLRDIMPQAPAGPATRAKRLRDIMTNFDALLLDGFGVLNVGGEAVDGAAEMLAIAAGENIPALVVTNAASVGAAMIGEKYRRFGLDIEDQQVVSSRDAMMDSLHNTDLTASWRRLGIADDKVDTITLKGIEIRRLDPSRPHEWRDCDAIALLGTTGWHDGWTDALDGAEDIPLLVANPDVAAPYRGKFSREPGYYAACALERGREIHWFGKPYPPHFDLALRRLEAVTGKVFNRKRIAMVGDSLHTDILGGAAAGLSTVLITGHGLFCQGGAGEAIAATGITPDYLVETV